MADFQEVLADDGKYMTVIAYNASPVTITGTTKATAVALGAEQAGMAGADEVELEITLDINGANNVRIIAYRYNESAGTAYLVPYRDGGGEAEYYEITDDSNHSRSILWKKPKAADIMRFYAYMGTDGGVDPIITASNISIQKN
jgi:hypothetical protein